jgi:hypothetical protein
MVVATRGEDQPIGMKGQGSHRTPVRTDRWGNGSSLYVEKAQHSIFGPDGESLPSGLKASDSIGTLVGRERYPGFRECSVVD